jgi:hypothetical protein
MQDGVDGGAEGMRGMHEGMTGMHDGPRGAMPGTIIRPWGCGGSAAGRAMGR